MRKVNKIIAVMIMMLCLVVTLSACGSSSTADYTNDILGSWETTNYKIWGDGGNNTYPWLLELNSDGSLMASPLDDEIAWACKQNKLYIIYEMEDYDWCCTFEYQIEMKDHDNLELSIVDIVVYSGADNKEMIDDEINAEFLKDAPKKVAYVRSSD
jgi:hypothetical protein